MKKHQLKFVILLLFVISITAENDTVRIFLIYSYIELNQDMMNICDYYFVYGMWVHENMRHLVFLIHPHVES